MKTWLKYKCRAKIPCFFQSSLLLWSGQLYNTVLYKHSLPLLLWPKKPSQCYLKHTSPGRLPSRVLGINLSILEIHFLTLLSGCPQLTSLALAPFSRINSKFVWTLSVSISTCSPTSTHLPPLAFPGMSSPARGSASFPLSLHSAAPLRPLPAPPRPWDPPLSTTLHP